MALMLVHGKKVKAQTTYSPYSMYGIGELETGEYGKNAGMAGVSIGLRNPGFLNSSNPASISAIDSLSFLYDFSASAKWSSFHSGNSTENTTNANFKKLAMGFMVVPRWAISLGIIPYSTVGYKIKTTQEIEGTGGSVIGANFSGSGGINKFYISNAFRFTPKISFGINTSYLIGSINNTELINGWSIEKNSNVKKLYFDFGMQYADFITNNISFVFGFIYGYGSSIIMNNSLTVTDDAGNTMQDEITGTEKQYLPMFYGIGVSVSLNNMFTVAADYQYQKLSKIKSNYSNVYFTDVHKLKLGIELQNNKNYYDNYFQRIHYQTGIVIENSYLTINSNNPLSYGLCFGLGLPLRNTALINLSFEFGKTGSNSGYGQIKEDYTKLNLSISFKDIWFLKRKYE